MEINDASHRIVADLLAERTGQQLTLSRRWRIGTALAGIFRERGITNLDQLVCLLALPQERQLAQDVVEALLNNETYFFRDKPTFDQLPETVLPQLAHQRAAEKRLRIWSAGCSTGQEAYSLAMIFAEQAGIWDGWDIDILGTDVSTKAIKAARDGNFTQFEIQRGLGVGQMLRHFDETPAGWKIRDASRTGTRFELHNILTPPPTRQKFDLILCRNVLLYFDPQVRRAVFERLRDALAEDGVLMLGAGETVVGQTEAFRPCAKRASAYRPAAVEDRVSLFAQAR